MGIFRRSSGLRSRIDFRDRDVDHPTSNRGRHCKRDCALIEMPKEVRRHLASRQASSRPAAPPAVSGGVAGRFVVHLNAIPLES